MPAQFNPEFLKISLIYQTKIQVCPA